jgi:hypothetical protein
MRAVPPIFESGRGRAAEASGAPGQLGGEEANPAGAGRRGTRPLTQLANLGSKMVNDPTSKDRVKQSRVKVERISSTCDRDMLCRHLSGDRRARRPREEDHGTISKDYQARRSGPELVGPQAQENDRFGAGDRAGRRGRGAGAGGARQRDGHLFDHLPLGPNERFDGWRRSDGRPDGRMIGAGANSTPRWAASRSATCCPMDGGAR